jgi:very-short-patch-repair endonuclease
MIGRWSVDFALLDRPVALEADGTYWHAKTRNRDARKDAALAKHGWTVVRLPEVEVMDAIDLDQYVVDRLDAVAHA